MRARHLAVGLALIVGSAGVPVPVTAQYVRVSGTTSARYLDVRPFVTDSVPVADTKGSGLLRRSDDGRVVRCIEGQRFCRFVGSGDPVWTAPLMQDLEVSVWGLGQGVRAYVLLRGRLVADGDTRLWPRSDDHLDPLMAYVEVDRARWRVRAGRQWKSSGLGFYNYDGAAFTVRPGAGLTLETFVGRSLVRGANEPRTGGALEAVEPFAPAEPDLLLGAHAQWRPQPGLGAAALYQRDIRRDRKGLHAERLAADATWRWDRLGAAGSVEVDLALGVLNEARLDLQAALGRGAGAGVFLRRHRPYFEAWTIWGAFDPVGFDEVGGRTWWRPVDRPVSGELRGAWRRYPPSHASTVFGTYRDTGWRLTGVAEWTPAEGWAVQARMGTDIGFGASSNDASARLERRFAPGGWVALSATAFERLYEFRVAEGSVWGVGGDAGLRLGDDATLRADVTVYRHRAGDDLATPDWSQLRAGVTLRWTVGAEPGRTPRGGS